MILEELSILNFKNLEQGEIQFSPSLNCFVGQNGSGKTNILDAIYYLSLTKSAMSLSDMQCVRHGEDFFIIKGNYQTNEQRTESITCSYKRSAGKKVHRGAKEYERLSEHIGLFPSILVAPQDTALIADSGDERRRFLNSFLSQIDSQYLTGMMRYNSLLSERNKILKNPSGYNDFLDILSDQLAEVGTAIYERRAEFVTRLAPIVATYYRAISGDAEQVQVRYVSRLQEQPMASLLKSNLERDMVMGHTTVGIHRDEIELTIEDYPIRRYGSQGQQKSLLVALRLSQAKLVAEHCGSQAILLLDDVFDKLDMGRVENLIGLVAGEHFGQIFITDSNKVRLEGILAHFSTNYRLFTVNAGTIE